MLGQQRVKKGTMIAIPIYALHRHRRYWEAPDAFDPDRFAPDRFDPRGRRYCYMPFGGGPRVCIGMAFALIEAQTMLVTLLRNGAVAPDPDEPEIEFEVGATLRPKNGLRVLFN
jgi:cytochrome P450